MDETMIERVARALAKAADDEYRPNDAFWQTYARAAIEAIFKGTRFTEINDMTVVANPDCRPHYWNGDELLPIEPAYAISDAALQETPHDHK